MASEFVALKGQSTWTLVPASHEQHVVHWVFKLKRNLDGSIARFKACLVAKVIINRLVLTMMRHLVQLLKQPRFALFYPLQQSTNGLFSNWMLVTPFSMDLLKSKCL